MSFNLKAYAPRNWRDYELIDSGDGEKLERFGPYILRRPEAKAIWPRYLKEAAWREQAHAKFVEAPNQSGKWQQYKKMPDQWYVQYHYGDMKLKFRLMLTPFKHVGVFPEQAVNWDYIYDTTRRFPGGKVLNLFAYTGGASLAARAGGAEVTHCDSIKSTVSWANMNMQASQQSDIRWLVEDAFKFVNREGKRGNRYQGIILDPPAFGKGPKGEKWKLEDMIADLTEAVARILETRNSFLVFNSYSLGFSSLLLYDLIHSYFGPKAMKNVDCGELYLPEKSGRKLPSGIFLRFRG